ncbi:MAG: HD-GYP domain-containing protein, partial [Planctomycetes bacterium]|nr:HD-GYP domain-containing protein [Planctomycetota bacterium]
GPRSSPLVANRNVTSQAGWRFPALREVIITPLSEGERLFGWFAAVNHREGAEFGTVEASLLSSVSAILGIHGANIDLYRQQNEFLASVVWALTAAIDAKDPYTCGHSDRVARVSVRLAQQMGCDNKLVQTMYMASLVHDIGKIGVPDSILRKPGRLTDEEFEHIKKHPELGHNILRDIRQLENVLPVVLHHHEQWNGGGYPHGLAGEEIPLMARICAVADAYDAMSSDRPYRKGMPEEKILQIFREGAGSQWDADVVEALLTAWGDVRAISKSHRASLSLDVRRWAENPAADRALSQCFHNSRSE